MSDKKYKTREEQKDCPSWDNEIRMYLHCAECLDELPVGESPKSWARLNVGWTVLGIQVWCVRHEKNVLHVDFEGQKHPANTWARPEGH